MSIALGSPMEALAINYLSYGVLTAVNNLWAWIAVVTAALSFCWKIKSSSSSTSSLINSLSPQPSPSHLPQPQPQPEPSTTASNPLAPASSTSSLLSNRKTFRTLESTIGTTSGKFTVYYDDNDHDHDHDDLIQEEIISTNRISSDRRLKEEEDGWEAVLRMKTGDMEWYRYQDLTALDGSVVRLWDDALPWSSSSSTIISY